MAVVWYAELPRDIDGQRQGNYMAMVWNNGPSTEFKGVIRERLYMDSKKWDSNDTRQGAAAIGPKEDLIKSIDEMMDFLKSIDCEVTRIVVEGSTSKFVALWSQQPFAAMQMLPLGSTKES